MDLPDPFPYVRIAHRLIGTFQRGISFIWSALAVRGGSLIYRLNSRALLLRQLPFSKNVCATSRYTPMAVFRALSEVMSNGASEVPGEMVKRTDDGSISGPLDVKKETFTDAYSRSG